MSDSGSSKKVPNSLVALSSAAILAVYTAGYSRTRSAAEHFAAQSEARRPATPAARGLATSRPSEVTVAPIISRPDAAQRAIPAAPAAQAARAVKESPLRAIETSPPQIEAPAPLAAPAAVPAPIAAEIKAEIKSEPKVEAPAPAPATPAQPVWKDGTYTGWGYSRHGDIQASVVVEGGRIASAVIAQCLTRYSCSVIEQLPPQVAQRNSPEVDSVSGATQSADAFYYAVVEALEKAK